MGSIFVIALMAAAADGAWASENGGLRVEKLLNVHPGGCTRVLVNADPNAGIVERVELVAMNTRESQGVLLPVSRDAARRLCEEGGPTHIRLIYKTRKDQP